MSKVKYFFVIIFWSVIIFTVIYYTLGSLREYNSGLKDVRNLVQIVNVEEKSNIIILGDTGTGSPEQYKVADAIAGLCARIDCGAAFITGDVIYGEGVVSSDDKQFKTKFELPYQEINFPFYIAFGNHDYLGCTQCYLDYSAKSEKWKMPASYYKINIEDVDYFVIDTESFSADQQSWLKTELRKSGAPWKVVVGHKPVQTNEVTHFAEDWRGKSDLKDIICNEADVYLSGHAHLLEYIEKLDGCNAGQVVSGGGGQQTSFTVPNLQDNFVYPGNGFVLVSSNSDSFEITYYSETGEELYKDSLNDTPQ